MGSLRNCLIERHCRTIAKPRKCVGAHKHLASYINCFAKFFFCTFQSSKIIYVWFLFQKKERERDGKM